MKTKIKVNAKTNFGSGYNPKIELSTSAYSASYFYQNSATKNTIAERLKNNTIVISNTIKF